MGAISLIVLTLPAIIGACIGLEQLVGYSPLLSYGLQLIPKLISIGRPLVKAGWLAITALLSPSGHPILISYSLAVFALTALWVRLVSDRQRGYLGARVARG
jgi:hypothetical protein